MALATITKDNLVNGVSQQAPSIRLASQLHEQENAFSSIAEGLVKRPPAEYLAKLTTSDWSTAKIHAINRSETEQFIVVATDTAVEVYDLAGNSITVTEIGSAFDYLSLAGDANVQFKLLTIADTTFLVNRETTVAMAADKTPGQKSIGLIWIKQAVEDAVYAVDIDGTEEATYTATATDDTTDIAADLKADLVTSLGAGWTINQTSNVISVVKDNDTAFTLDTRDTFANQAMKGLKDETDSPNDLPPKAVDGMKIRVLPDPETSDASYYLEFVGVADAAPEPRDGNWIESIKEDIPFKFDASTMPHVLVRTGGGFDFKEHDWADREVGDETSAADPSFVGQKINNLLFFRNRLGFLADNKMILTQSGELNNFWPTTVATVLDDQRIDTPATGSRVADLRNSLEFQGRLILSTDSSQMMVDSNEDILSVRTINIVSSSTFKILPDVDPVAVGASAFYGAPRGDFSGVREYFLTQNIEIPDPADITKHVPKYVKGNITNSTASPNEDILVMQTDDDASVLYIYQWHWQGNQKLQSAWHKWLFNGDIVSAVFFGDELFILRDISGDGTFLEKIKIGSQLLATSPEVLLDRRLDETQVTSAVYSAGSDSTTITLPYKVQGPMRVVAGTGGTMDEGTSGTIIDETIGGLTVEIKGDWSTEKFFVGELYTFKAIPTEPYPRAQNAAGAAVSRRTGRLQVAEAHAIFEDSGYCLIKVKSLFTGQEFTYEFNGSIVGAIATLVGSSNISDATFRVPIRFRNTEHELIFESNSHLPVKILGIDYRVRFTNIAAR